MRTNGYGSFHFGISPSPDLSENGSLMARLPGYMRVESTSRDLLVVCVRPWHPSILADIWRMLRVRPAVVKPVVVLAAWAYLMVNL